VKAAGLNSTPFLLVSFLAQPETGIILIAEAPSSAVLVFGTLFVTQS